MIVYVATFFDNSNIGSELQASATQYILNAENYDVVFIKKGYQGKAKKGVFWVHSKLCSAFQHGEMKHLLKVKNQYSKSHACISEKTKLLIHNYSILSKQHLRVSEIQLLKMKNNGIFLCGSDQIWSPLIFPLNGINYLKGIPSNRKIAYSASFGMNQLPNSYKKKISPLINSFSYISMREKSAANQVASLRNKKTITTCDPVFLLDKNAWNIEARKPEDFDNSQYTFCYFLDKPSHEVLLYLEEFYSKTKIVYICYKEHLALLPNAEFVDVGPDTFLYLVKNADSVITDSFHAVAFSLIFNKEFHAFSRNHPQELSQDGRIIDLLSDLNISDRMNNYTKDYGSLDFDSINTLIGRIQHDSKSFLLDALTTLCKG